MLSQNSNSRVLAVPYWAYICLWFIKCNAKALFSYTCENRTLIWVAKIYPNTTQYRHIACPLILFTPTFPFFYTDVSAISATFRNSGPCKNLNWTIKKICQFFCFSVIAAARANLVPPVTVYEVANCVIWVPHDRNKCNSIAITKSKHTGVKINQGLKSFHGCVVCGRSN